MTKNKKRITLRVPREMAESIVEVAKQNGLTVNSFAIIACRQLVKDWEKRKQEQKNT